MGVVGGIQTVSDYESLIFFPDFIVKRQSRDYHPITAEQLMMPIFGHSL